MDFKILTKVRGLLAKAESTEFPEEAEALTAKAMELMAAHGIDQARLAARGEVRDDIESRVIVVSPPYAVDKVGLLAAILAPLRCQGIQSRGKDRFSITAVGFASDLDRAELLYTSLLIQATGQILAVRPSNGENLTSYRKGWFAGFANKIRERLAEMERAAAGHSDTTTVGPSTALVLADRSQRVDRVVAEMFPHVRAGRKRTVSGDGWDHGQDAGARASLGSRSVDSRKVAIGGGR